MIVFEDNDAVIKIVQRGRTERFRHVPRTHRIDLDFVVDILEKDPGLCIRYISTKAQVADIFTKGQFTSFQWKALLKLCLLSSSFKKGSDKVMNDDEPVPQACAVGFAFITAKFSSCSSAMPQPSSSTSGGRGYGKGFAPRLNVENEVQGFIGTWNVDPFVILGVNRDDDEAAIHRAYRIKVRDTHPDKIEVMRRTRPNLTEQDCIREFQLLQNCYEILKDPIRKRTWFSWNAKSTSWGTGR